MTEDKIREIAFIAWKGAASAHRMYPENKHTFAEYWIGAKDQFSEYFSNDVVNPEDKAMTGEEIDILKNKANKWDNLDKEVGKFFCDSSGEYSEENPEKKGDLGDLGEIVTMAFGWTSRQ